MKLELHLEREVPQDFIERFKDIKEIPQLVSDLIQWFDKFPQELREFYIGDVIGDAIMNAWMHSMVFAYLTATDDETLEKLDRLYKKIVGMANYALLKLLLEEDVDIHSVEFSQEFVDNVFDKYLKDKESIQRLDDVFNKFLDVINSHINSSKLRGFDFLGNLVNAIKLYNEKSTQKLDIFKILAYSQYVCFSFLGKQN